MARNLEHLELPQWQQALPRRKRRGPKPPERGDRQAHGQTLLSQAEQLANQLQSRRQTSPRGINPKFIFKLQLHQNGSIDEEQLRQMGLRLLAKDTKRVIVVFPDEESLAELQRRLRSYAREEQYAGLAVIEAIEEIIPEDRIGLRLKEAPLSAEETAHLDIELWHSGNQQESRQRIDEIAGFLERQNLKVTDSWIGESLCLVRAKVTANILPALLGIDYIKEIDRRPSPSFEMLEVARLDISQLEIETTIPDNLVGVLIVDSGVMQQHPLIAPALGDAQVFPGRLHDRINENASDGDERTGGHGTAVAGIALYNDVGECMAARSFRASARLFSARVTDENNEYDEEELLEHQLTRAVEYFLDNYPLVKVVNISLGDLKLVYSDGSYQFRLAAAIDELAYKHRDREIVFVISAGNYFPSNLEDEEILREYPAYLLNTDESRVINPATAALAITVGGLSYGTGRDRNQYFEQGTEQLVAGEKGWPSPFTRTGWGVDGAIKPEVVDYAGDLRFERGRIKGRFLGEQPEYAGLPTTAKNFAPPTGRLFRTVAGTSFAAPRVANLAARLFKEFPTASSNLIRALIADSARLPVSRPPAFSEKESWDKELLRVYGYGQPDFTRARWSDENETLLLTDGLIDLDSFQIFTIPALPQEFLTARGNGYISATLAFDPPTRHTRGDSYLGITMDFDIFRNVTPEDIAESLRAWDSEEKKNWEDSDIPALNHRKANQLNLKPGKNVRKAGTLQRGIIRVSSTLWQYDGNPMYVAVTCQRKWAPVEIQRQRFALVVSLLHDNPEVDIYARVSEQTQISQRVRVRV